MKKDLKEYLQGFGVKPSMQRLAIMEYLMTHKTHPTVDEIFTALYPRIPTLSKTTVYNTLKLLEEQGAVLALDIDPRNTHYDGDISAHSHFMCRCCGMIYDLTMPEQERLLRLPPTYFRVDSVQVYYKGICERCDKELN